MSNSILYELLDKIRVKYLFQLFLVVAVGFLFLTKHHFSLIPLWALHLNPDHSVPPHDEALWTLVIRDADSHQTSTLVVIRNGNRETNTTATNAATATTIVTFHLPSLDSPLLKRERGSKEPSTLHKLTPASHAQLPSAPVVALSAFFWNDKLITVIVSTRRTPSADVPHTYVLSTWDQEAEKLLWERSIGPVPSNPTPTSGLLQPTILTSTMCVIMGQKQCGFIFALVPTQKPDGSYHFSTLALSAETGQILWHHLPGDFGEDTNLKVVNISAFPHWKLRLLAQHEAHLHIGEAPWPVYRDAILQALPIYWYDNQNSRIQLVHHEPRDDESHVTVASKINTVLVTHPQGVDLLDIASGRPLARLPLEWKPGSTYANLPSVNQSSLFSHFLTTHAIHELRVSSAIIPVGFSGRGVHVNLDSAISAAIREDEHGDADPNAPNLFHPNPTAFGQGDFSHQVDCRGRLTGLEANFQVDSDARQPLVPNGHTVLYTGLCRPSSLWEYARLGRPDWLEDETKSVPPLIVKPSAYPHFLRGLLDAVRRHDAIRTRKHTHDPDRYDLIFLTSDGSLTSVSNRGQENWHINSEVSWFQVSRSVAAAQSGQPVDPQLYPLYTQQFRPSLSFFPLTPFDVNVSTWDSILLRSNFMRWTTRRDVHSPRKISLPVLSVVVVIGWDSVSLVDPGSGTLLATHRLPCRPTHAPTLVRLPQSNLDQSIVGEAFIIPCEGMLLAFGLTYEVRIAFFFCTVISLFLSFLVLHWCCQLSLADQE